MMLLPAYYRNLTENEIASKISSEGTNATRVVERPGSIYQCHKNLNDIVLAFLRGSARVTIGDRCFDCRPGDRLVIKGDIMHSAVIGSEGCTYLMTQIPVFAD